MDIQKVICLANKQKEVLESLILNADSPLSRSDLDYYINEISMGNIKLIHELDKERSRK